MAQATDEFKTSHAAQATEQYFIHVFEHNESSHGHKQQQDKADDWSDDDLYDVERIACLTHAPRQ